MVQTIIPLINLGHYQQTLHPSSEFFMYERSN